MNIGPSAGEEVKSGAGEKVILRRGGYRGLCGVALC